MSLAFLLTTLVVVVTPGTGVVYTLAAGLSHGRRASLVARPRVMTGIRRVFAVCFVGLSARMAVA